MIYGCTSYTARLALEDAASLDLSIILGGRSENKIKTLASGLNLPYRIFELDDAGLVDASLKDVKVLLNCSGPCKHTAQPLMTACIRTGTHYIDIAAELDSYERALQLDQEARDARVLLMPGCGGSVAMLGCLANYALERVENPKSIDIALHVAGSISRGSAVSASEGISNHCLKRAEGVLVEHEQGATLDFELPRRQRSCGVFPSDFTGSHHHLEVHLRSQHPGFCSCFCRRAHLSNRILVAHACWSYQAAEESKSIPCCCGGGWRGWICPRSRVAHCQRLHIHCQSFSGGS